VADAAVDGPERGEQTAPGVDAVLEHLLAVLIRGLAELGGEGRDGVVLVVERVAQQEQAALLGREEEDQPHHHGHRRLVEARLRDAPQQGTSLVAVGRSRAATRTSTARRTCQPSWSVTSCWSAALSARSASRVSLSATPKKRRPRGGSGTRTG
jgi:hypothetical protein